MKPSNDVVCDQSQTPETVVPDSSMSPYDPELAASLEEFLSMVKRGNRPTREEFLARHAGNARVLTECLDGLEFILSAAHQLDSVGDGGSGPAPPQTGGQFAAP